MKKLFSIFFIFSFILSRAQTTEDWKNNSLILTPEFLMGKTMESNDGFPKTRIQRQFIMSVGRDHRNNPQEWAYYLKGIKTGFSLGITDFGNLDSLGLAFSAMPYIEFRAFGNDKLSILTGLGTSYFTKKFNAKTNPQNQAVTTDLTWAFRLFFYSKIISTKKIDWKIGAGYSHHSNGHTRLMNQGYNSFLIALSADIGSNPKSTGKTPETPHPLNPKSEYEYLSIHAGLGQNVFAMAFNQRQDVYILSGEFGKVYNNTFKIGLGIYYRFYQHYFDYIEQDESLVQRGREFEYYQSNPWYYASNLGISVHGEILLNHVGINLQLGYNLHKPGYKIEWRINEGWEKAPREIQRGWELGDINTKYHMKYRVSSRLGLKYYFKGTEKAEVDNFYIGAFLNANLGQADFSELSVGYVRSISIN